MAEIKGVDLGNLFGFKKKPRYSASTSMASLEQVARMLDRERQSSPTTADIRALRGGSGDEAARRQLADILGATNDPKLREQVKSLYETGEGGPDQRNPLEQVLGGAGSVMAGALEAVGYLMRGVQGGIVEANEAVGTIPEDDISWLDNLTDMHQGYGQFIERLTDEGGALEGVPVVDNRFVKGALGFTGDVALDPLTYLPGGVIAKGASKAALEASAKEIIEKGAAQGVEISAKKAAAAAAKRAGSTVDQAEAFRRLGKVFNEGTIDKDTMEVIAKQIDDSGRGLGRVSAEHLDLLGLRGGVRTPAKLGGKTVIPHDVARQLARPVASPLRGVRNLYKAHGGAFIADHFGDARLTVARQILRDPNATGEEKINAVLTKDMVQALDLHANQFASENHDELADLLHVGREARIDGKTLNAAMNDPEGVLAQELNDAHDGLIEKLVTYKNYLREAVNAKAGRVVIGGEAGEIPLKLNEKALRIMSRHDPERGWFAQGYDLRRLPQGTELAANKVIGSPELAAEGGLKEQVEAVARSLGIDNPWEDDGYKLMAGDLQSVSRVFGLIHAQELMRENGLIRNMEVALDKGRTAKVSKKAGKEANRALKEQQKVYRYIREHLGDVEGLRQLAEGEPFIKGATDELGAKLGQLRQAVIDTEEQLDAAIAAGRSKSQVGKLRKRHYDAGKRLRDARRAHDKLRSMAGIPHVLDDIEIASRLGTVQSPERVAISNEPFDHAKAAGKILTKDPAQLVVDHERRLEQIRMALDGVSPKNVKRKDLLRTAEDARTQAVDIAKILRDQTDLSDVDRYGLSLQLDALDREAMLFEKGEQLMSNEELIAKLQSKQGWKVMKFVTSSQFKQFGLDYEEAPNFAVNALTNAHMLANLPPTKLGEMYAAYIRGFKTLAIATPGFDVRNWFGAFFNNMSGGVDLKNIHEFAKALREYRGTTRGPAKGVRAYGKAIGHGFFNPAESVIARNLDNVQGEEQRRLFEIMAPFFHDSNRMVGEFTDQFDQGLGVRQGKRFITQSRLFRGKRQIGEYIEEMHRGAMLYDHLKKGGTFQSGMDKVHTFHFDYKDLSRLEHNIRKVIPFYVWTSRNLPLQLEQMLRNPKVFQRYVSLKNEIEGIAHDPGDDDQYAPEYIRKSPTSMYLGMRLPDWLPLVGGKQVDYVGIDLPIAAATTQNEQLASGPAGIASVVGASANPLLRVPIEQSVNTKFFAGIPITEEEEPAPSAFKLIPPLLPFLEKVGFAKKQKNGTWTMSNRDAYWVTAGIPTLTQAQRLAPNTAKGQEDAMKAWASIFMGMNVDTVTDRDARNEMYERARKLKKIADSLDIEPYEEPE